MPIAYDPKAFFSVIFQTQDSAIPAVMGRAVIPIPFAILAVGLKLLGQLCEDPGSLIQPFSLLVGLMLAFRLSDALSKWKMAAQLLLTMHEVARDSMSKAMVVCHRPGMDELQTAELLAHLENFRRLMVLTTVLMMKHVRGDIKHEPHVLAAELSCGLLRVEEMRMLQDTIVTTAASDPSKGDFFPSRNRVALGVDLLRQEMMAMWHAGYFPSAPHYAALEANITKLSALFEQCEHLGITIVPLLYAQLTRLLPTVFLLLLPFSVMRGFTWEAIPFCYCINVVYFALDEASASMEAPFGRDVSDVALEKTLRRIDKLTASQLGAHFGKPIPNFDIFPGTRSMNLVGGKIIPTAMSSSTDAHAWVRMQDYESTTSIRSLS
uniref:Bestrophin homolog n=1 Tax=Coccolithus braarudii TaxID=221442 RepID=A0A7S0L7X1_9EUKA|mmetsp:Transcript_24950/g.53894  ORF Transcript_24950/g.53894 Transcript_24950/m.53894 type:complete len:379 (+) Transcript_24950:87-1223(+)